MDKLESGKRSAVDSGETRLLSFSGLAVFDPLLKNKQVYTFCLPLKRSHNICPGTQRASQRGAPAGVSVFEGTLFWCGCGEKPKGKPQLWGGPTFKQTSCPTLGMVARKKTVFEAPYLKWTDPTNLKSKTMPKTRKSTPNGSNQAGFFLFFPV